jgi:hypothetical protein
VKPRSAGSLAARIAGALALGFIPIGAGLALRNGAESDGPGDSSRGAPTSEEQGSNAVVFRRDWKDFKSDADLKAARLFGVDGAAHRMTSPVTRPQDYYELIPDSVFGQVVRYKGGPWANTVKGNIVFGAVAVHVVTFEPLRHVWVRQFIRFSPNYWPVGKTPERHNNSYKIIFLRWAGAGFRQGLSFTGSARLAPEYGQGGDGGGVWPGTSVVAPSSSRPDAGFAGQYDVRSMIRRAHPAPRSGDGEWYEFVLGHEQLSTSSARGVFAWRRYTDRGRVSPVSWTVNIVTRTNREPNREWAPARRYDMGVNRNKSFDEEMSWDWGPYEIVDGSRRPNPFGIPGL